MSVPVVVSHLHTCKTMWRGGTKPTAAITTHGQPGKLHLCIKDAHNAGECVCRCGSTVVRVRKM